MLQPSSENSDVRLLRDAAAELARAREALRSAEQQVGGAASEIDDSRWRLEQVDAVLHVLIDEIADVVVGVDAGLDVTLWSHAAEAVFGAISTHALGRQLESVAPELLDA